MEQATIKALLKEATHCDRPKRSSIIQNALSNAAHEDLQMIVDELFVGILQNRRELLSSPSTFTVFALLCGNRDDRFFTADIDWSLVD